MAPMAPNNALLDVLAMSPYLVGEVDSKRGMLYYFAKPRPGTYLGVEKTVVNGKILVMRRNDNTPSGSVDDILLSLLRWNPSLSCQLDNMQGSGTYWIIYLNGADPCKLVKGNLDVWCDGRTLCVRDYPGGSKIIAWVDESPITT